ncbi:hydroxymethylglutaryl-CoA lyase [bacterium (Candidatus Blackallbacteria) CG17_big_fil_post_rev_8_21_14_2_50_48_46]|uniref:Hydroxymethylglutaryl-CoA lyase n=1 Tax=bacterium (Candidatus Blackallbacteria) CG17_big_fil_post_rev_8_21_14_2_50_48_46 TaxID=2014261 RepID=A0A2M7G8P1_9BACT|nr:MAG: hydroxymethylglutaryl-CoA lyase [bacterium (Candidatus Blackallbacteria) CG18_big_fil_WC_8_21_14_2_50_49_26]PIW18478.1 MAG: hydroxymethylglutaryl-CoA lyase [bacterium (Candidatus Blackallbacteria) CG17_big_fil_post_rev_8_21_14_2_50_48_46]PIW46537.1 MAG: hydroxymethylglutaryl-CoA lyase [bacterium (Candidatus Blackallbacteria) CG13_big_fil_rev_8_21_14_2_50_49_14]
MSYPEKVLIYEVGPRDGLQNEAKLLSTETKLGLISGLVQSGLREIEIGSFVRPDRIPPLADTDPLARALPLTPGVHYSALVPNAKGLERAISAGLRKVAIFMSATESHNQSNTNRSTAEALQLYREVAKEALAQGIQVRAYLSTVFGCPYEGKVEVEQVLPLLEALLEMGVYQISLGDTIGISNPRAMEEMLSAILARYSLQSFALHLHDTRGTALANALIGLQMGFTTFDSAIGGLGGCPYAPGASGNLATEDLVYMLQEMGIETGVHLGKLVAVNHYLQKNLGKKLNSKYVQTIPFSVSEANS